MDKIKTAYTLLIFVNWVPLLFLVNANIPFKCFWTGLRRKPFLFLFRISNFQNQNTYERNFNIVISNTQLFSINVRIDIFWPNTDDCVINRVVKSLIRTCNLSLFCASVGMRAYLSAPFLKRPALNLILSTLLSKILCRRKLSAFS